MNCYVCYQVDHFALEAEQLYWYEKDAKIYCQDKNKNCSEGMPKYCYKKMKII